MFASHLVGPAARLRHIEVLAEVQHERRLALLAGTLPAKPSRAGRDGPLPTTLRTIRRLAAGWIRLAATHERRASCGDVGAR